jgi:hypothetical protein
LRSRRAFHDSAKGIGICHNGPWRVDDAGRRVIQAPKLEPRIMRYELTDYEWTAIKPFLPNKPRGVPRVNDRRSRQSRKRSRRNPTACGRHQPQRRWKRISELPVRQLDCSDNGRSRDQ